MRLGQQVVLSLTGPMKANTVADLQIRRNMMILRISTSTSKQTQTDSHVSVGAVPSSCSWLQLLRPLELSTTRNTRLICTACIMLLEHFVPPPGCSSLCSDRVEIPNVGSMLVWNDTVRDPALRLSKARLLNLLCGAGNFVKIRFHQGNTEFSTLNEA